MVSRETPTLTTTNRGEGTAHSEIIPNNSLNEVYSAAGKIHLRRQVEDQKEYAI